ncbi:hypothetical protein HO173_011116 [Letharia columbiana]|uniref:BAG domain-containing protein n=1 Tax=Letharia columbiana TaxID=112416 RepID=A0A8H6L041_9LECA|nr:uncharacterized protein HO173_011116 [Letharia columbiana]KAF6230579.1 hypothetical protein HO173_011116 [Letharia columbiana]
MASDLASITSSEYQKPGFREKILALKNKAPLAAGERTDPAFENSFGDQLSDLGGRQRWVLVGLALQRWHQDLRDRVGEVLRENEGEIYKGRSIRGTATLRHCWMLGHDKTCAQPTVVISCNQSTVLKRTYRVVSQHGVLKAAKFALKAIPFCDLRLRMDRRVSFLSGEDYTLDENGDIRRDDHGHPIRVRRLGSEDHHEHGTQYQARMGEEQDQKKETYEKTVEEGKQLEQSLKAMTLLEEIMPVQHDMDTSDEEHVPLRFGAEEIIVPDSGRPTTLGGFIMVDDVCFGLTTAHAFTEEDEGFGQRSLSGSTTELPLYDSDWANEDSSDDGDENEGLDPPQEPHHERRLQRKRKSRIVEDQSYYTTAWNSLHITAKSRLSSAKGLDWALCELGDWGKYAINGVYLHPELRSAGMPEHLLFRNIKSTPPLGKILVATRRGAVPGIGTGSDCAIKFPRDNRYRRVWSVELGESLSSGDSGSWVVDATTGDVYGMIIAGSTGLREEYVIPAVEIGQDICRVMRANTVRLPTFQDVMTAHTEERSARPNFALNDDAMGWESDDSDEILDEEVLDKDEERFLLAEVLKNSSIDTETLVKVIKDAGVRPKWTKISLPKGRSMKTSQRAIDRLLSSRRLEEIATQVDREFIPLEGQEERRPSGDSDSKSGGPKVPRENAKNVDDYNTVPVGEPPELLDSNPKFRAETSRRAWRAKRQAERGPKPHHRKSYRKSDEFTQADPTIQTPDPVEPQSTSYQSKFEMDSEDEPGSDEPDIIVVRHKGSLYKLKFPAFSLAGGLTLVGHLRQQAATEFDVEDASRVTLVYQGKTLKTDASTCHEEGLKMRSEVLCVVKRTPIEDIDFLSHKFHTELVPQGLEFISNTPADPRKRDFEYRKISETILAQILLKSDAVETEDDTAARMRRKELNKEVNGFLTNLDIASQRDVPSAWHADFIEQKQTPGTRRTSTVLPNRPTPTLSRSSNLGKSDSRNDDLSRASG